MASATKGGRLLDGGGGVISRLRCYSLVRVCTRESCVSVCAKSIRRPARGRSEREDKEFVLMSGSCVMVYIVQNCGLNGRGWNPSYVSGLKEAGGLCERGLGLGHNTVPRARERGTGP